MYVYTYLTLGGGFHFCMEHFHARYNAFFKIKIQCFCTDAARYYLYAIKLKCSYLYKVYEMFSGVDFTKVVLTKD